jgi:hypothetical protein
MFSLIIEYRDDCKLMEFETFGDALFHAQMVANCEPGVWSVWITDTELWGEVLYEESGSFVSL